MNGVLNKPRTSAEASLNTPLTGVVSFGPFVFDRVNGLLARDGRELPLPPRAIGVLVRLIDRAGDVVSKAEILDHVWRDTFVTEVSLTEAISLLRQVLDDDPQHPTYIQTLPRRGYRFVARLDLVGERGPAPNQAEPGTQAAAATTAAEPDIWPAWLPWALMTVLAAALVAVSAGLLRQPGLRERPVGRFSVETGPVALISTDGPALALSRDGTRLVSVGQEAGEAARLYLRELAQLAWRPLPGTEGGHAPFFSPDGQWVGFFANGRLKKVPIGGGAPVTLCEAPNAGGATWTTQGTIVFAGGASGGLSRVAGNGGRVEPLTVPDAALGEVRHLWPDALASGRAVIFTGWPADGAPEAARVAAVSLDSAPLKAAPSSMDVQTLVEGATFGRAMPTGHLLFLRDGVVLAAAFDAEALALQSPSKPVLTTVALDERRGVAQFAMAASGILAELTTAGSQVREGWRWSPGFTRAALPFAGRPVRSFAYEAERDLVAAAIGDGHRADIWVDRLDGADSPDARVVRLTSSGHNAGPVWTDDGSDVIFASREEGAFNLFIAAADASSPPARLTAATQNQLPSSVSADGRLVYTQAERTTGLDIWSMPLPGRDDRGRTGGGKGAIPLVRDAGDQTAGATSPDGRWLAYQSERSGRWSARVRDLHATPVTDVELGASDGQRLEWEGGVVLLVDDVGRLRACRVSSSPPPGCVTRVEGVAAFAGVRGADGAALVKSATATRLQLEVVLEWSKELSAQVPVRPREVKPVR